MYDAEIDETGNAQNSSLNPPVDSVEPIEYL